MVELVGIGVDLLALAEGLLVVGRAVTLEIRGVPWLLLVHLCHEGGQLCRFDGEWSKCISGELQLL